MNNNKKIRELEEKIHCLIEDNNRLHDELVAYKNLLTNHANKYFANKVAMCHMEKVSEGNYEVKTYEVSLDTLIEVARKNKLSYDKKTRVKNARDRIKEQSFF